MDIDKIVLEFRKLYQMDFGIKTEEAVYVIKKNGMVEGQLNGAKHWISKGEIHLEFSEFVAEDMGTSFLLSVLSNYFEKVFYDQQFERLIDGTLSKEKSSEYMKQIIGKRMDYLNVISEDLDSVIHIIQATFINSICVKDKNGLIVFIEEDVNKQALEGATSTIEVELLINAKWVIGEKVDAACSLEKQKDYLKKASYLLRDYLIQKNVMTLSSLLPYTLIDACSQEAKNYLMKQVFKHLRDILLDEELTATIEMMFKWDLNLTDSAKALYIHRNTLLYRIEKIYKFTGYDLRKFSDAFVFKLAWLMCNTH